MAGRYNRTGLTKLGAGAAFRSSSKGETLFLADRAACSLSGCPMIGWWSGVVRANGGGILIHAQCIALHMVRDH